ncbi:hypothetical protein ACRE_049360 [Hapsidospora chrysogenum ATCC 11550]|uniref:Uncharacterized protein n=1 Tax=Hapsidospora chrysogenum (strain ATCC 11550 / CBS 779.69 / DSM 880 / IAM 14645 / JCM 23072 / IMI 49137) TaxID=857340 RepID=A0A086T4L3_HAPC1|nr:hypothetical protein ACRE_049360 [Hapsidospora chrysogenum ATCC 11550]
MAPAFAQDRAVKAALLLLPVVVPAIYLYRFSRQVSSKTTATTGRRDAVDKLAADGGYHHPLREPASIPDEVRDSSRWEAVAYERIISHPIPASSLVYPVTDVAADADGPSELMRAYTSAAQVAFVSTPQGYLMRAAIKDPQTKLTFDVDWIRNLLFRRGDLVNGAYRVVYHGPGADAGSERVELAIEKPPSYKGHVPRGLIVSEIHQVVDDVTGRIDVIFANETWMWRRRDEAKTLIETAFGSWFHCLTVGWLVVKGVDRVMGR